MSVPIENIESQTIELTRESLAHLAALPVGAEAETVQWLQSSNANRPTSLIPDPVEGYLPRRHVSRLEVVNPVSLDSEADVSADDYRIVGKLGSGGTAIVYQAHQRAVNREVALKYLRPDLPERARARKRFLDEARVIGALDHPNVIAIHEVCLDQHDEVFYAMKRVDGTTWDQRLDDLSVSENISILLGVANGIRYAHSHGLVHRDIKPANVMLGKFSEVLLADWGLAFRPSDAQSAELVSDSIGGTPAYMAPELALGLWSEISYRTDVYLLGGLLYRIVTGVMPHRGDSLMDCIRAAADNLIQPTEVEGELVDIARRAMNTRPADRYQTVDEFIAAIRSQQQHAQSIRLTRSAEKRLREIPSDATPAAFSLIDTLLIEAMELWPDNARAAEVRQDNQVRQAELLVGRGDFETALSLYEAAGLGETETAKDIRKRKKLEKRSLERVSRYSSLFFNSPDAGLLVKMPEGTIVEVNRTFAELFGYAASDVIGKRIVDLKLWVCPRRRAEMVAQIARDEYIDDFETELYRSDGKILNVILAGRSVQLESETMLVSTIRDVSRRKAAERELRQSRTRLHDLQRLARLATWSYNVADDSVSWSEELFQMTGRDSSAGTPTRAEFYQMVHPDDRERLRRVVADAVQFGRGYEITIKQIGSDGDYQTVLIRGEPIRNDEGVIVEVYGVSMPQPSAG